MVPRVQRLAEGTGYGFCLQQRRFNYSSGSTQDIILGPRTLHRTLCSTLDTLHLGPYAPDVMLKEGSWQSRLDVWCPGGRIEAEAGRHLPTALIRAP